MKTLLRLSLLIAPLFPVMALAVLFGTAGFLCAIAIPALGVRALFSPFPLYLLLVLGVARGVLHYAEQYCNHFIAFTLLARIRRIVFEKLRALGPAKLAGKQKGDLISLLTADIELLELFYAHTVSPVCIAFLVDVTVITVLYRAHPLLALIALMFHLALTVLFPLFMQRHTERLGSQARTETARMNAFLLDALRGIQQSILYGRGEKMLAAITEKSALLSKTQKALSLREGLTASGIELIVFAADITTLIVSSALCLKGALSFNQALFSVVLVFSSFGASIAVARLGTSLAGTIASGKRVLSLLDEKPAVTERENALSLTDFTGASFSCVRFAYSGQDVLSGISLTVPKTGITGIQGKSGSGKSTLLRLLMRFWDVADGKISISDVPIAGIAQKSLRTLEGFVTQETELFHDTIENNIRLAKLDATHEEITAACKKAGIHDFIMELPEGYQTQVGELGDNFSGGERQRLGLARAFLHDAPLLLLDEPTSNLDSYNEQLILQSVRQETEKRSVVLVSHRESTLKICDRIYTLENGRNS